MDAQLPPKAPEAIPQPDTHQLDKLPDLPAETPWYKDGRIWIVILFFISCAGILAVCGFFHISETVSNAFITANATLHTVTAGTIGADKVARKAVYGIAANKDGISAPAQPGAAQ